MRMETFEGQDLEASNHQPAVQAQALKCWHLLHAQGALEHVLLCCMVGVFLGA